MSLKRLAAIRNFMRSLRVEGHGDEASLKDVGLSVEQAKQMYRLLALAPRTERFVLPTAAREQDTIYRDQGRCGFSESP